MRLGYTDDQVVAPDPFANATSGPLLTLLTSIQEPQPLPYGVERSTFGRLERNANRMFVLDHRARQEPFAIRFKISLIQNTSAGGGAGAAMALSGVSNTRRGSLLGDDLAHPDTTPHTFIFVVKRDLDEDPVGRSNGKKRNHRKHKPHDEQRTRESSLKESLLPPQWLATIR